MAGAGVGYEQANTAFHEAIYRGSGNAVVIEHLRATRKRLAAFGRRVMDQPGRLVAASREHAAVIEPILWRTSRLRHLRRRALHGDVLCPYRSGQI